MCPMHIEKCSITNFKMSLFSKPQRFQINNQTELIERFHILLDNNLLYVSSNQTVGRDLTIQLHLYFCMISDRKFGNILLCKGNCMCTKYWCIKNILTVPVRLIDLHFCLKISSVWVTVDQEFVNNKMFMINMFIVSCLDFDLITI